MPGAAYDALEEVDVSGDKWTTPLPLGPESVLHGVLANGLTYYVRPCSKPKERAALALVVKVGSVVEEDSEAGVAHIVEHLAFNATESFSNHQIVKFLESIGAGFGACQNAYTSSDETCYQLVLPVSSAASTVTTDSTAATATASITASTPPATPPAVPSTAGAAEAEELTAAVEAEEGDLAKERGAVLEEWRMARNAQGRAAEAHWRLIMQGSRYEDRLPIGKEQVVKGVSAETVKAFYERWYRPENMAVVVVGDFTRPADVAALITTAFQGGASRDSSPARPVPCFGFADHEEPRYKVFVDKEVQDAQVWVSFKYRPLAVSTPADFLKVVERWVFHEVLNTRLYKLSRGPDPPFASANVSDDPLTATTHSRVLAASAMEGQALRALESLLTEVARIRLHGITPRQLKHALADLKSDIENTYLERDQSYCWDIRDEYCRHFLQGEFVTGQAFEARLSKTLLSRVTRAAVEALAAQFLPSLSCVVKVTEHRKHITEGDLAAVVARVTQAEAQGEIGPWEGDAELPERLIPNDLVTPLESEAVVSEKHCPLLDATELVLRNGMRVVFKSTSFMEDEVMMTGMAHGGLTEIPQPLFYTAAIAPAIAAQLGMFGLKPHILNDFLAGQRVDVSVAEKAFNRSLSGVQSPGDLETVMQLVHLLFTAEVKVDEAEVEVVRRLVKQSVEANLRNPLSQYQTRCKEINYGDCYYFKPVTLEELDRVDMQQAVTHHNRSFKNPAEFTLLFTGNVQRDRLLPLVLQYLATIPPSPLPAPRALKDITPLPWSPPTQPHVEDVKVSMVSPITQAQLTFPVKLQQQRVREDLMWVQLACMVLETRLLQRMRFQFGEIYTVSVSPFFGCEAPSIKGDVRGDVSISFTCDPANRQRLINIALEEVKAMQSTGVREDEIQTVVTLERLQYEESLQENSHWHDTIMTAYQSKSYQELRDIDAVYKRSREARTQVLAAFAPSSLRDAMQRVFPYPCRSCYTAVAMVPQPPSVWQRAAAALAGLASAPAALFALATGKTSDASTELLQPTWPMHLNPLASQLSDPLDSAASALLRSPSKGMPPVSVASTGLGGVWAQGAVPGGKCPVGSGFQVGLPVLGLAAGASVAALAALLLHRARSATR
ncbi:Metalloenzyme, LuxS/M16 peptidase-like protein [Haematococcus lacustris]